MTEARTETVTDAPPRRRTPRTPPAQGRPTLPATDASDSDVPLTLSADALEGTRDRALAFEWTDVGYLVRKRPDGVYERIHVAAPTVVEPETLEFYPDVEMLDRRILDPQLDRDVTIQFRDEVGMRPGQQPKYYKRWCDTRVPHRYLTLTQRGGYKVATWDMLADKNEIGDRSEGLGQEVARGEKGQYKLLFMPYTKWLEIKTAQANARTRNERTQMATMAARAMGPQAADMLTTPVDDAGRPAIFGTIKEGRPMSLDALESSKLPKDVVGTGDDGEGARSLDD